MTTTKIGIMPFAVAQEYDVRLTNKLISLENPSYKKEGVHRVVLNINHVFTKYDSDSTTFYREMLERIKVIIPFTEINPPFIVIENEELKEVHGRIYDYCDYISIACEVFPEYRITNGGLTMPEIALWYYSKTNDKDFYSKNIPTNLKASIDSVETINIISKVDYELDFLKGLTIPFINIHYYLGYAGAVDGWIRMINFIKEYTGKNIVSDEAGTYTNGLLPEVVRIARETEMRHLILFSGEGIEGQVPAKALPINKPDFENAII